MPLHPRAVLLCCAVTIAAAGAEPIELFGGYTTRSLQLGGALNHTHANGRQTTASRYFTSRLGVALDATGLDAAAYPAVAARDGFELSPALLVRNYSLLAGPQVRLFQATRLEISLKALIGASQARLPASPITAAPVDQTSPASVLGLNFDIPLSRGVGMRFSPGLYTTRYGGSYETTYRFSIGPVFRLAGRKDTK